MAEGKRVELVSECLSEDVKYNHYIITGANESDFSYHTHDRYEIILVVKGDMKYVAEGKSYDLAVGDLILTRPSAFHAVMTKGVTCYERYDSIFNEKIVERSILDRIPKDRDVFKCTANERMFDLFSKLDFYYNKFTDNEYAKLTESIIAEAVYNLTLLDGAEDTAVVNPLIDKATDYIRTHLSTVRGLDEISDALYVTKSHLHHLFIKYLHMTPSKYILSKRLLKAQKRILSGGKPTEVYTECGFDDYATFFRNYKRYFGYSPSVSRNTEITREIL